MLKVKLIRIGKKNQPSYRIAIAQTRKKLNGKYIESLGFYQPLKKTFKINLDKYKKWQNQGAQPTKTVIRLVKKYYEKAS